VTRSLSKLLLTWFPGTSLPFICSAPMFNAADATLAVAVTRAGGLGTYHAIVSLSTY
jgi:nitronate monooxygenase